MAVNGHALAQSLQPVHRSSAIWAPGPDSVTLPRALGLAFRSNVSPCDATFVLLARDLGCDLVTADRELYETIHESCSWVRMLA